MNFKVNKKIYRKVKEKGIGIQHVCEVGVYLPETSNIIDFIKDGLKTTLVEPEPKSIAAIQAFFNQNTNINLHPVAVYDYQGKLSLSKAEASTFVSDLTSSPALVNDNYKKDKAKMVEVDCVKFSQIDEGDIDLLSIDTEGSEWYVLKHIQSRPKVISLETHGKKYINPFLTQINAWISENNYIVWFKDQSDTVYIQKDLFALNTSDKVSLAFTNMALSFRRWRKSIF